jgi:NADH-quinone oxidoreductase subunit A
MDAGLIPILIFAVGALLLATGMLAAGTLLGPKRSGAVKQMPYESGMDPVHDTRRRFDVRFHLVAIAFLIFDVELLFLYPWAVANKHEEGLSRVASEAGSGFSTGIVFAEVMFFIALLALGFVYAWRKGVFRWR